MFRSLAGPDWTLEDLLADGAAGPVWRCVGPDGARGVMKTAAATASEVARSRLAREAALLARLPPHPALPRLLAHGASEDGPWLVIEEVPGRDLRTLWTAPPISWAVAVHAMAPVADAVAHLHAHGIVHRDIKPANLLVHEGRATLLDLGAASDPEASRALTHGASPATPRWAPPEALEGQPVGPPGDVYALGQILHELLMGGPAFPGDPDAKRRSGALDPGERAPGPLRDLIHRTTAREPDARPTAAEVAAVLGRLDVGAVTVPTPTLGGRDPGQAVVAPAPGGHLGRYVLGDEIGRGGMGRVLRAWDPELERDVALKVLAHRDGGLPERFRREARALARLDHPGFVKVLDMGRETDIDYFVMELVDGPDLARLLLLEGPVPVERARRWLAGVADALAAAHARGLVHRDIKPSNLLVDGEGGLRIVDLGIVGGRGLARGFDTEDARTTPGLGTPRYMAPEQATDGPTPPAADVYALAVVLHEVLTGRLPWDPPDLPLDMRAPDPDPSLPDDVVALLRRSLQVDPDRRPSARSFAETLRGRPRRRAPRRWLPVLGLATGASLLAGLVTWTTLGPAPADPREEAALATWERAHADIETHLAAGEKDEARAVLSSFAAFPPHQGTRAQTLAWWYAASAALVPESMADSADPIAELFGRAFVQARDLRDQRGILLDLAARSSPSEQEDRLVHLVDALQARTAPGDPELERWQRAVDHAYRTERTPSASPLDALRAGTPLDVPWSGWFPLDVDQDGTLDLFVQAPGSRFGWYPGGDPRGPARSIPVAEDVLVGEATWTGTVGAHGPHALLQRYVGASDFEHQWVRVRPEGITAVAPPRVQAEYTGVTTARMGGEVRLFAGATTWDRVLHEVDITTGETFDAHPETSAANAEIRTLLAMDLDEDGDEELLVGTGPWGGWDLRVLDPGPDGRLSLRSRTVLGDVNGIHPFRTPWGIRLLVGNGVDGLPTHWEPDAPPGASFRILRDTGEAFTQEAAVPVNTHGARFPARVADLDGDGLDEAVARDMRIVWFEGDELRLDRIGGLHPLAVLDVDGDGDDEVIARDVETRQTWLLGVPGERLPPLARPEGSAQAPADGVDGPERAAWTRAETLAEIGYPGLGAERLVDLSRILSPEMADRARLRAAELYVVAGQGDRAERTLAGLARRWGSGTPAVVEAVEALVDLLEADVSLEAARTWAHRRLELARRAGDEASMARWTERVATFEALVALPVYRVDPARPLEDQGFVIDRPLGVSSGPTGVHIQSTRPGTLARRLVALDGRALILDLTWDVPRAEWATQLAVVLRPVDPAVGAKVQAGLISDGGRGNLRLTFRCRTARGASFYSHVSDAQAPLVDELVTLRMAAGPTRRMTCEPGHVPLPRRDIPRETPFVLSIEDLRNPRDTTGAVHMGLVELRLHGARPLPWPDDPAAVGLDPPSPLPLEAGLAAARAGGPFPRLDGPNLEVLGPDLIRWGRPHERAALRAALGPADWRRILHRTWSLPARMHLAAVADPIRITLADLPMPAASAPPDDRRTTAALLLLRASAALHLGRFEGVREDLDQAEAILEGLMAGEGDPRDPVLRARTRRLRAITLAEEGQPDLAMKHLLTAIASSPSPQIAAEEILSDARLSPLRDHPGWARVRAWRHRTARDVALTAEAESTSPSR